MAKKSGGKDGGKANFYGTYSCFPDPLDGQGKSANGGNVKSALNSGDPKKGNLGKVSPLAFLEGQSSRADVEDLNEHPNLGQSKIAEITKSKSSFGPADRGYMKGAKK